MGAQKCVWSLVKIATEDFISSTEIRPRLWPEPHPQIPGVMALEQAQLCNAEDRPRKKGHACTVAKEFTRRGVRSDDAGHQPPGATRKSLGLLDVSEF